MTSNRFKALWLGQDYLLVIFSAVLTSLSIIYVSYFLAWIAFAFLFFTLFSLKSLRQIVYIGFVFGGVSSGILNTWMIPAVRYYAKGSMMLGVFCWMVSAILIAFVYGSQFLLYHKLRFSPKNKYTVVLNGVLMAVLWVLAEWLRAVCFSGMPWLSYSVGITQSSSLYLLQPAALGSVYILSFALILANYFLSYACYSQQWRWSIIALSVFFIQIAGGFFQYQNITARTKKSDGEKITTALILASLPPEAVWDETNGEALVQNLIRLNHEATQANPDLILWSESIIPWTYTPDDDFVKEITKGLTNKRTHHLLGMNTAANQSESTISNSAYLLNGSGRLLDRYDKQELLTIVEKPLWSNSGDLILPFLAGTGIKILPGKIRRTINSPWGKAGVLLCNESAIPALTTTTNQEQISYLVNLGNDGWFSNYFITRQHFFNARLRAVEARKDILINNNLGISGVVRANGDIAGRYQLAQSSVQYADIYPNHIAASSYLYFMYFLLFVSAVLVSLRLYYGLINTNKQSITINTRRYEMK